jgi:hypothetical protein
MNVKLTKIGDIKMNPNNPRTIKDDKFRQLVKSITEFPKMLELRPIVVNDDMIVLGGNMRLKACKEAGLSEIPVIKASELTDEEQRQFIIKDNVGYGEWDFSMLKNDYSTDELEDWGLDIPDFTIPTPIDYSALDGEDISDRLDEMTDGVRKAIQIEFELEHYEEANELVHFWRAQKLYIGGFLMEKLKEEKDKLD